MACHQVCIYPRRQSQDGLARYYMVQVIDHFTDARIASPSIVPTVSMKPWRLSRAPSLHPFIRDRTRGFRRGRDPYHANNEQDTVVVLMGMRS